MNKEIRNSIKEMLLVSLFAAIICGLLSSVFLYFVGGFTDLIFSEQIFIIPFYFLCSPINFIFPNIIAGTLMGYILRKKFFLAKPRLYIGIISFFTSLLNSTIAYRKDIFVSNYWIYPLSIIVFSFASLVFGFMFLYQRNRNNTDNENEG